ncbi:MAG: integrase [Burkholderiaceae bacterium]|nr:integrase [Burkholderiaceae bacterium]
MPVKKTHGMTINEAPPGKFIKLERVNPCGTLEVRKLTVGAQFYWRTELDQKTLRVPVGLYDSGAPPKSLAPTSKGYSVAAALRKAETIAEVHKAHLPAGGWPSVLATEEEVRQRARAAAVEAKKQTLHCLLLDYCAHLEALGRTSHANARSLFKNHVFEAWPAIAATPANEVTGEQISDMMRRCLELGLTRTGNKLRSFIRAAYGVAKAARSKASVPVRFKAYAVTQNPADDTVPDDDQNRADKNPLSLADMRLYWQTIRDEPGLPAAVCRVHLLLGGQRIAQLLRLKTADIGPEMIVIYDGKGRPGSPPRPHAVPLPPLAKSALAECSTGGTYAFSTDGGDTPIYNTTLAGWACDFGKRAGIEGFKAKRLRSGVETALASAKVSREVRGHLQSHGITGVQAKHYDAYDYLAEKRQALETLFRLLARPGTGKNVSSI